MNKFESLQEKSDSACLKAIEFWKKGDFNMSKFWKNLSNYYKEQSMELFIDNLD